MSLLGFWERRKTLLFIVSGLVLCTPALAAGSGLNVAVIGAILTDTGALFAGIIDLVIACIPLILVLLCVGLVMGLLVVLGTKVRRW